MEIYDNIGEAHDKGWAKGFWIGVMLTMLVSYLIYNISLITPWKG
jgi:hypothetical protein